MSAPVQALWHSRCQVAAASDLFLDRGLRRRYPFFERVATHWRVGYGFVFRVRFSMPYMPPTAFCFLSVNHLNCAERAMS